MIVPPHLLAVVKALQMHSHRFVPQSIQVVMTDFISQNLIYKHLRNVIEEAEERKELFISLFNKKFDDNIRIKENTTSSFHLLAEFTDPHLSDESLVSALEAKGIVTHPESKCYLDETRNQGLILGYSCINKSFMSQFLVKMAGVYLGKGWV
jgi:GntR family transcriptional regulator/MocR family aminotransferase